MFDLSGRGSPEGAVAARVGTRYRDISVANGALLWVKASGTGPTGWRVVQADTGWRDISTVLAPHNLVKAGSSGHAMLRRIGQAVQLQFRLNPTGPLVGAARSDRITLLPPLAGFGVAPATYGTYGTLWLSLPAVSIGAVVQRSLGILERDASPLTGVWAAGDLLVGQAAWITDDAWPTTLPGTPL